MNRKVKNTLFLVGILILILVGGFGFILFVQQPSIEQKEKELDELKAFDYDPVILNETLMEKEKRAELLDSILAARKFNIPMDVTPLTFYDFLNRESGKLSDRAKFDTEFLETIQEGEFYYYLYKVNGQGSYNDLFQLIFSIEQSKELKKVRSMKVQNYVMTDEEDLPVYLVTFEMNVAVYYATNPQFSSTETVENNLNAVPLYDVYYPLIRTEIPPNVDDLFDVQGAKLLALLPEGAFLVGADGREEILVEWEPVYLGFLTKIDYEKNTVTFMLNKGGIIEHVVLEISEEGEQIDKQQTLP
jgi:hypothetical protein